jgi:hypothetical protein
MSSLRCGSRIAVGADVDFASRILELRLGELTAIRIELLLRLPRRNAVFEKARCGYTSR